MHKELELVIHDLLIVGQDTEIVAHEISEKLIHQSHRYPEREAMIRFVIQSGYYTGAFKVFSHWFKLKTRIPWQEFLNLIQKTKFNNLDPEFYDHFFEAIRGDEEDALGKLKVLKAWEKLDSRFEELFYEIEERIFLKASAAEKELFDKLEYFRTNRMIEQEEKLLNELIIAYPEKSELQIDLTNLKARWAHHYVAEKARELEASRLNIRIKDEDSTKPFAEHLKKVMVSAVNRYPQAAYDFSIGLHMVEFYDQALELLNYTMPQLSVDWFRAELMFKCRRYLECLDELVRLEETYMDDPESSFSSTYLRAQVLKGLGQKKMAIKLLRSITNVRPNYRSAHGLIVEWEREA